MNDDLPCTFLCLIVVLYHGCSPGKVIQKLGKTVESFHLLFPPQIPVDSQGRAKLLEVEPYQ